MSPEAREELVTLLAALRGEGRQQSGLDPALVPPDKATAYEIASEVAARLGTRIVGWKIAAAKAEMQRALRTDAPIYGPVYEGAVLDSPARVAHARQLDPIPEAEYIVRIEDDLPPREAAYSQEEVAAAIGAIHCGLELAECRFPHDDDFPPLEAILADGAGGGSLVLGPEIADWQKADIPGQTVRLLADGTERGRGTGAEALDHPVVPLTWLANELSRRGIGLHAGEVISTGTLTGMVRPSAGETYSADFGPFGTVEATYE